jgi:hypothetical protein
VVSSTGGGLGSGGTEVSGGSGEGPRTINSFNRLEIFIDRIASVVRHGLKVDRSRWRRAGPDKITFGEQ